MITDIKVTLAKNLGWSLYDIDRTDIRSLLQFMNRLSGKTGSGTVEKVFVDQVNWL